MDKDLGKIIMNPVRQRIAQYLILNGHGTAGEIAAELSDIPRASLYRHIKILQEHSYIKVVSERKIRGATEKTYELVKNPPGGTDMNDIALLIQSTIMSVSSSFMRYFRKKDIDPQKDMLSVSSSTIMMSDDEFTEFFGRIGAIYNDYIYNKPSPERKTRCITFISAPSDEKPSKIK